MSVHRLVPGIISTFRYHVLFFMKTMVLQVLDIQTDWPWNNNLPALAIPVPEPQAWATVSSFYLKIVILHVSLEFTVFGYLNGFWASMKASEISFSRSNPDSPVCVPKYMQFILNIRCKCQILCLCTSICPHHCSLKTDFIFVPCTARNPLIT